MLRTTRPVRFAKAIGHTAALMFCGFWLIATSAGPPGPARDCFTGINNPTKLAITLGPPDPVDHGQGTSCGGLDGLVEGTTVVLNLSQREKRPQTGRCWGYQTESIEGVASVALGDNQPVSAGEDLTEARGIFTWGQSQDCRGGWTISLGPGAGADESQLISPLDARLDGGGAQNWHFERQLDIDQAQSCGGLVNGTGSCGDWFPVVSITQVSP